MYVLGVVLCVVCVRTLPALRMHRLLMTCACFACVWCGIIHGLAKLCVNVSLLSFFACSACQYADTLLARPVGNAP